MQLGDISNRRGFGPQARPEERPGRPG